MRTKTALSYYDPGLYPENAGLSGKQHLGPRSKKILNLTISTIFKQCVLFSTEEKEQGTYIYFKKADSDLVCYYYHRMKINRELEKGHGDRVRHACLRTSDAL